MKIYYILFSQLKCVVEDCKDIYHVNKYHTIEYVFTYSLIYKLLDIVTCIHSFLFVCFVVIVVLSHHIAEILSKVALNTIILTHPFVYMTNKWKFDFYLEWMQNEQLKHKLETLWKSLIDHINNTRNTDAVFNPRHFSDLMRWHFCTTTI